LDKILPGLPTANIISQPKFQFRTTALLRPTARTLQLSVAFCACIVQQAKCNVYVLQCRKQKYSLLFYNAAVHSTMQTSPLCVHFESHQNTTEAIQCMLQSVASCFKHLFCSTLSTYSVMWQVTGNCFA